MHRPKDSTQSSSAAHLDKGLQRGHDLVIGLFPLALLELHDARPVVRQEVAPVLWQPAGGRGGVPAGVGVPGLEHGLLRRAVIQSQQGPKLGACSVGCGDARLRSNGSINLTRFTNDVNFCLRTIFLVDAAAHGLHQASKRCHPGFGA